MRSKRPYIVDAAIFRELMISSTVLTRPSMGGILSGGALDNYRLDVGYPDALSSSFRVRASLFL